MSRFQRTLGVLAVLLVAGSTLGACAGDGPFAIRAEGTQELARDVAASGPTHRVRVEMFNGSIEIRAGAPGRVAATVTTIGAGGSKAEAEADRAKIQVTLDADADGTIVLRAVYGPRPGSPNNRAARAVVDVPPGATLDLRTSNGGVTSTGVGGAIAVKTSNGPVNLRGAVAGATVRTSNNSVEIEGGARLDVETSNAAVILHGTDATVRVQTSNGSITFDGTLSGDEQSLETSNENIDLLLPVGASFSVDATTSNAVARVDGFAILPTGATGRDGLEGTVGEGGPTIILRTSNGPITISAR